MRRSSYNVSSSLLSRRKKLTKHQMLMTNKTRNRDILEFREKEGYQVSHIIDFINYEMRIIREKRWAKTNEKLKKAHWK